jgi:hypothetical protein
MKLINKETGESVSVSETGGKALLERGTHEIPTKQSAPKKSASESGSDAALKKMKLTELLAHAASAGVDDETLAALSKPGTSKAQVIEAIAAAATDES